MTRPGVEYIEKGIPIGGGLFTLAVKDYLREFQVLCMYIYNALPEDHIFMYEDVYKSDLSMGG